MKKMKNSDTQKQKVNFESDNPYIVLQVNKNSTKAEIKMAYKTLAKQYHPDLNKNDDANKIFIKINVAYHILINEETREQYDNGEYYENDDFGKEAKQSTETEEEAFNYLSPKEKRVSIFVRLAAF